MTGAHAPKTELEIGMADRLARYRHAIVPHIYVDGAAAGIEFYKRAFDAVELFRIARSDGTILHAELSICGSVFMMGDPDGALYARRTSSPRRSSVGEES
jgi:hypothetical protein